jgi:hypothetical protein
MHAQKVMPRLLTELDFFVEALKELQQLKRKGEDTRAFQFEMQVYFRLPQEMSQSVYDCLLRLSETTAGTSTTRSFELLDDINNLKTGDIFYFEGRQCVFYRHFRFVDQRYGFFEYEETTQPLVTKHLDYEDAWSALAEGRMSIEQT